MATDPSQPKLRYPLRAILLVALAWLGFLLLALGGFALIALMAPIACFYVGALVGYVGLVSEAHEYARRHAYVVAPRRAVRNEVRARSGRSAAEPSPA